MKTYWKQNLSPLVVDGRLVLFATLSGKKVEQVNLQPLLKKRIHQLPTPAVDLENAGPVLPAEIALDHRLSDEGRVRKDDDLRDVVLHLVVVGDLPLETARRQETAADREEVDGAGTEDQKPDV